MPVFLFGAIAGYLALRRHAARQHERRVRARLDAWDRYLERALAHPPSVENGF